MSNLTISPKETPSAIFIVEPKISKKTLVCAVAFSILFIPLTLGLSLLVPIGIGAYCFYHSYCKKTRTIDSVARTTLLRKNSSFENLVTSFLNAIESRLKKGCAPRNSIEWHYKPLLKITAATSQENIKKEWGSAKEVIPYLAYPNEIFPGSSAGINLIFSALYSDQNKYVFWDPDSYYANECAVKIAYTPLFGNSFKIITLDTAKETEKTKRALNAEIEKLNSYNEEIIEFSVEEILESAKENTSHKPSKMIIPLHVTNYAKTGNGIAHAIFMVVEFDSKDSSRADITIVNTHGNSLDVYRKHEETALKAAKRVFNSPSTRITRNTHCCYSNAYSCVADTLFLSKKLVDECPSVYEAINNNQLAAWKWKLPSNYRQQIGKLTQQLINSYTI